MLSKTSESQCGKLHVFEIVISKTSKSKICGEKPTSPHYFAQRRPKSPRFAETTIKIPNLLYVCHANNYDCFYLWKHRVLLFRKLVCGVSTNKKNYRKNSISPVHHQTSVLKMVPINRTKCCQVFLGENVECKFIHC